MWYGIKRTSLLAVEYEGWLNNYIRWLRKYKWQKEAKPYNRVLLRICKSFARINEINSVYTPFEAEKGWLWKIVLIK